LENKQMNEQERSRLIERIAENHLNESERAELLAQLGEGTNVRQELLAEQAISRAIARDRQQLPVASTTPSPRLLDALSNAPVLPSAAASFWGSGGLLVGFSLVIVVGVGLMLFPGLFGISGDAAPTSREVPPAAVADTSSSIPAVIPSISSEPNEGKKWRREASTPVLDGKPAQPTEHQGQQPQLPVFHDNSGAMPISPK
jgi:hypothetical protein